MDECREKDGVFLREYFCEEKGYFDRSSYEMSRFFDEYCSVLEMLVALSIRMDREWVGDPSNPTPDMIFVELLENLGIFIDDKDFKKKTCEIRVKRWLDRKFDYNGKGSIFPLKINRYREDQRGVEIWRQMTAYISENKERLIR